MSQKSSEEKLRIYDEGLHYDVPASEFGMPEWIKLGLVIAGVALFGPPIIYYIVVYWRWWLNGLGL